MHNRKHFSNNFIWTPCGLLVFGRSGRDGWGHLKRWICEQKVQLPMIDEWEGYIGLKWLDPILTQRGKIDIFISVFQIISQEWGYNMNCLLHIPLFQIHILSFYSIIPCLIIFRLFTIHSFTIYPNLYLFFSFLFNSVLSLLNFLFIWFSFFPLVFQVTFHSAGFYPFPFHYPSFPNSL